MLWDSHRMYNGEAMDGIKLPKMTLITQFHMVPTFRMLGAVPSLPDISLHLGVKLSTRKHLSSITIHIFIIF